MSKNQIQVEKIAEIHRIDFKGQVIVGTYEDLEELCITLEDHLFDEPTYDELNVRIIDLEYKNEKLEKELRFLKNISFQRRL